MEINQGHRRMKLIQYLVTFLLVAILAAMIFGYIYYGMNLAKKAELSDPTPNQEMSDDEEAMREQIINDLSKDSNDVSEEQKQAIINELGNRPAEPTDASDDARIQTIKDLGIE